MELLPMYVVHCQCCGNKHRVDFKTALHFAKKENMKICQRCDRLPVNPVEGSE